MRAHLRDRGQTKFEIDVVDLSRSGFRAETSFTLWPGTVVWLTLPGLRRWRRWSPGATSSNMAAPSPSRCTRRCSITSWRCLSVEPIRCFSGMTQSALLIAYLAEPSGPAVSVLTGGGGKAWRRHLRPERSSACGRTPPARARRRASPTSARDGSSTKSDWQTAAAGACSRSTARGRAPPIPIRSAIFWPDGSPIPTCCAGCCSITG